MIRTSLKVMVAVALSGCTVNNIHHSSYSEANHLSVANAVSVTEWVKEQEKSPAPVVNGNMQIHPNCGAYVPLTPPAPVEIDLNELKQAQTTTEINAIVLRNVKDLNRQMKIFAIKQEKHYAIYVKKCVITQM